MIEFKHPSYYAKIKKQNRLTNKEKYDREIDNEKIPRPQLMARQEQLVLQVLRTRIIL